MYCLEHLRIVHRGQRVQVGDEVERLLVILQLDVLADGAEIIAPMRNLPVGWSAGEGSTGSE